MLWKRAARGDQAARRRLEQDAERDELSRDLVERLDGSSRLLPRRRLVPEDHYGDLTEPGDRAAPQLAAHGYGPGARPRIRTAADAYAVQGQRLRIEAAPERSADWPRDPGVLRERIRACTRAWLVALTSSGPVSAPASCGAALCPRCQARRAGRLRRELEPVIRAVVEAGAGAPVMVTSTQREPVAEGAQEPVVLTREERRSGLFSDPAAARRGRACPHGSLAEQVGVLREATHRIAQDSSSASWWRETTAGAVHGREWTGRIGVRGGEHRHAPPWRLRWHAHQHSLVILRRDAAESIRWGTRGDATVATADQGRGSWWNRYLREWTRRVDAESPAQDLRLIDEGGIAEVLKYPFKPGELTTAQVCEVVAATTGDHLHQIAGAFHGNHRVGRAARVLAGRIGGDLPELEGEDLRLAEAIAAGMIEVDREREGRAAVLLYRRAESGERRRPLQVAPGEWGRPPSEQEIDTRRLVPVTFRWLLARQAEADATGVRPVAPLWGYAVQDGEWSELADVDLAWLLHGITGQLDPDPEGPPGDLDP